MKRNYTIIAGLILATGLSGLTFAQGAGKAGGCDGMGPMGMGPMTGQQGTQGRMKFDPAQRAERHLSMMKSQLKITPDQEPLWNAYAEKMKAGSGKGLQAMRQSADEKLTAPERMAKMQGLMEEHLASMKDLNESFGRLYAALTPEQKATADQFASRMGQGKANKRPGGGKPGQGPGRGPQTQGQPQPQPKN